MASASVAQDAAGQSRVFLAAPVGTLTFDRAEVQGRRMYAARSQVAGTASLVSLSSTPLLRAMQGRMTLSAPLMRAALTSGFGVQRILAGGATHRHAGVDLAAPLGSPVGATFDGRVSSAGWAGSYGLLVVLNHGNGMETRYAHLSSLLVAPGQQVHKGDLIGLVGSTGRSTGPHLHYELRQDGRPLNPLAH